MTMRIDVEDLNAYYGDFLAVEGASITMAPLTVTAFIGPSGCGKSTFLRTLNRMHEVILGGHITGTVRLDGQDLYGPGVDPVNVRRSIGMVFQQPNPFPTMTVYDNVAAGYALAGVHKSKNEMDGIVESCLKRTNLWEEVKDRLHGPGAALSGGQQQRLCIARAIAIEPTVLLMDEPCSALDPISTLAIEDLIGDLKASYTIVIVTHNMQQAARISDRTAFFNLAGSGQAGTARRIRRHRKDLLHPAATIHRGLRLRSFRLTECACPGSPKPAVSGLRWISQPSHARHVGYGKTEYQPADAAGSRGQAITYL